MQEVIRCYSIETNKSAHSIPAGKILKFAENKGNAVSGNTVMDIWVQVEHDDNGKILGTQFVRVYSTGAPVKGNLWNHIETAIIDNGVAVHLYRHQKLRETFTPSIHEAVLGKGALAVEALALLLAYQAIDDPTNTGTRWEQYGTETQLKWLEVARVARTFRTK